MAKLIEHDQSDDGIDRRGFLRCMAWAGTGVVWALEGGLPLSIALSRIGSLTEPQKKSIFFAQISDSHIGFSKEANKDVTATLQDGRRQAQRAAANAPRSCSTPATSRQLAKPEEFDTARAGAHGRQERADLLRARRARRRDRQRRVVSAALRQGHEGRRAGTASTTAACTSSASSTC